MWLGDGLRWRGSGGEVGRRIAVVSFDVEDGRRIRLLLVTGRGGGDSVVKCGVVPEGWRMMVGVWCR